MSRAGSTVDVRDAIGDAVEDAVEERRTNDWQYGLFGCFRNCGLCIWTFICPCIVFGNNAKAVGDRFCINVCFFFIPILNMFKAVMLRGKIRDARNIPGSCVKDLLVTCFCGFCSLVQARTECVEHLEGVQPMARS